MSCVRRATFTLMIFYPNKHTASTLTFTRHLFLLLLLNMYTHKFKVFANIVYPVQTITSEITNKWILTKKKKEYGKIIYYTPIIVFTYYFGHISYYLCIFLLCSVSTFPWCLMEIYTKLKNSHLARGFSFSSDGYFWQGKLIWKPN